MAECMIGVNIFFQILKNLEEGLSEDGSALTISQESRNGRKNIGKAGQC